MAKAPISDAIMAPDKMKPLLALSKREPVQAAIALTGDGDAVMLLDKKAKPKKVLSMLRASAGKAKLALSSATLRFGRAEVDTDYDSGVVRLFINKEAPGAMRVKLTELVKRIPYQKVEINVDPSLEEESEDEAEATEAAALAATPPQEAAAPVPDAGALTAQLRELIGRIPQAAGTDAARKAGLSKQAMEIGGHIKAAQLAEAAAAIASLRAALDTPANAAAATAAAAAGGTAGAVAYGKARLIWLSTRKKVMDDIERLTQALRADYADEGLGDTIAAEFRSRVAPVMAHFDESLADTLDDAINQTDPARRGALVAQARQIVGSYQTYLASEQLIALLDENPYEQVGIVASLTGTLSALSAAIR